MIAFHAGAATDIGQVRAVNQDLYLVSDDLFVVADGMGGHHGGEIAAQLAVDGLRLHFSRPTLDELVHAVERANDAVISQAKRDPDLRGMGTTLSALAAVDIDGDDRIAVVNVGDSRTYLLQNDELLQITKDHSLVEMLVDEGTLSRADAAHHPQRNIVTRALGIDEKVMVDSFELLAVTGDRYLICSDGLFNEVPAPEIVATLRHFTNPNEAAHELVHLANEGGGRDNITCVIVDVVEGNANPVEGVLGARLVASTTGQHRAIAEVTRQPLPPPPTERDGSDDAGGSAASNRADGSNASTRLASPDRDGDVAAESPTPTPRTRRIEDLAPPRRFTWRVAVFGALFVVAIVIALFAVGFSARNTFYVGFEGDAVAIYRGRPGGVLWIDPTIEEVTDIPRAELPPRLVRELDEGKDEDSLDSARDYVEFLRDEAEVPATGADEAANPDDGSSTGDRDLPRGVTTTTVPTEGTVAATEPPP